MTDPDWRAGELDVSTRGSDTHRSVGTHNSYRDGGSHGNNFHLQIYFGDLFRTLNEVLHDHPFKAWATIIALFLFPVSPSLVALLATPSPDHAERRNFPTDASRAECVEGQSSGKVVRVHFQQAADSTFVQLGDYRYRLEPEQNGEFGVVNGDDELRGRLAFDEEAQTWSITSANDTWPCSEFRIA
jgi:hypothetical protein